MKIVTTKAIFLMFLITLLLVLDYFPILPQAEAMPKWTLFELVITLFLYSSLFNREKSSGRTSTFKWKGFELLYFLILLSALNVLGGQSSTAISFDNGFLSVVLLLSIIELSTHYKKVKQWQ